MSNNSSVKPQLLEYPAAKGDFFAAKSKFVYWNEILELKVFLRLFNHSF